MAATISEITAAIKAPWLPISQGGTGQWSLTPFDTVKFGNEVFAPADLPSGSCWVQVQPNSGQQVRYGVGRLYAADPSVLVAAHTPMNWGMDPAIRILDAATELYRGVRLTAGSGHLFDRSFSPYHELPADGWFKLAMQISFKMF